MKVFERVLEARLRKIVSVSLNQCGFVKDCSTINAIHAVRILLEKHRGKNRSVHLAFLDLKKAFDRVPHELLWMSMRSHRVPEEYVRWTKLLYAKPTSVLRCAAGTSRPFPVQVGVHQSSSLSPLLFILCMDTITKEIQKQHLWTLLFADDVMLASESRDDLQKHVPWIQSDIDQEGRARVNAAWNKWKMATGALCDKKVPVRLKSKIYRTVVRPVALYGCDCWPTTKALESLGKSAARYGDADVEVDDRRNAKRESIQRHCTFHFRRRPDN
ncbi:reverse transcriptase [Necator americanus]|uniref:Reverse transcriptase n=1 Tax=Necator americanus TaxID=51031 RepID=W2TEE2_NECAM|nr:reverse transcriptase [Necator americanus]ETN79954.1 reverse transcriptase [Necator americanus]